jgi:hypothetical protein
MYLMLGLPMELKSVYRPTRGCRIYTDITQISKFQLGSDEMIQSLSHALATICVGADSDVLNEVRGVWTVWNPGDSRNAGQF